MQLEERFVNYLENLVARQDRGALAALRRSLAFPPGTWPRVFPLVEPFAGGLPETRRRNFYLAAGLFAYHQRHSPERTLPQALALLRHSPRGSASLETRFLALLEAGADELPVHLRRTVFLVKEIPFNWSSLLKDLGHWWQDDRAVQLRWAREFYANSKEEVSHESA